MALGAQGGDEEQAQPLQSTDKMGKGTCFFRTSGFGSSAPGNLGSRINLGLHTYWAGGQNLGQEGSLGLAQAAGSATEMMFCHSF